MPTIPSSGEYESKYINIASSFRTIIYELKSIIKKEFPEISNKITVGTIHTARKRKQGCNFCAWW